MKNAELINKNESPLELSFQYLGECKGYHYFCIISDDDNNAGVGISKRYHYYVVQPDHSIKSINYMQIPSFKEEPTKNKAIELKEKLVWFFREFFPENMKIVNR